VDVFDNENDTGDTGIELMNMRGDGNCLYYCALYNMLQRHPTKKEAEALCQEVCTFIANNLGVFVEQSYDGGRRTLQSHLGYYLKKPINILEPQHCMQLLSVQEFLKVLPDRCAGGGLFIVPDVAMIGHALLLYNFKN
jgi:hypothetical protein